MSKIDWWNVGFTAFFALLAYIGYVLVGAKGWQPSYIDPWPMLLLALAAFRLTRFVVYDSITKWFRDLVEEAPPRTFTGTIKTLVNCAWCTSLWAALVVATVYFAWPTLWFFIFVLALGGVAALLQLLSNLIGWQAEFKKRATLAAGEQDFGSKCG